MAIKTMSETEFNQKCKGDCENCLNSIKYRCPMMPQEYLEELNSMISGDMIKGNSRMLTTTEIALLLHVHPNTVRHWANRGLLNAYRLGPRGDRRFKHEDVDSFITQGGNHKP